MKISIHRPNHLRYLDDRRFGDYLAGLIDGDGHFNKLGYLVIVFAANDVQLAYWIKERVGYGHVRKIRDKNAVLYVLSNKDGLARVGYLVANKLCHIDKVKQYNERLVPILPLAAPIAVNRVTTETSWLSGFIDADGSLQIYFPKRQSNLRQYEVRLLVRVDQKSDSLLSQIKVLFGGSIGYREKQDTYYYSSVSFKNMSHWLHYFDRFSLQSRTKHLAYIRLRRSYLLVQQGLHLTSPGFAKLQKLSTLR